MATQAIQLLHWLNIDWIKQNSSLSNTQGIPLTNRWVCLLNAPKTNSTGSDINLNQNGWLELQVLSAEVPNIGIEAQELELNGARRFFFKTRNDSDLSITFLDTPSLLLRRFFYAWQQIAVDISESKGVRRHYMNEYMPSPSNFIIFPLDYVGQGTYCDRFINVFPYDISGISFNYAQAGEVIKTTVKFKYMYHHITAITDSDSYHTSENGYKGIGPDMESSMPNGSKKYKI